MTKMTENNLIKTLRELGDGWKGYKEIKESPNSSKQLILTNLEKIGFVERENGSELISESRWRRKKEGNLFLRIWERQKELEPKKEDLVVMTLPNKLKDTMIEEFGYIKETNKTFKSMLKEANQEIKILSPYIDASIVSLLSGVKNNVNINIITTATKYTKTNPILERLKSLNKRIDIKYLNEFQGETQMFQLHAKIILIDSSKIYLGSANLKETSLFHNLESGIVLHEKILISKYGEIFNRLMGYAS